MSTKQAKGKGSRKKSSKKKKTPPPPHPPPGKGRQQSHHSESASSPGAGSAFGNIFKSALLGASTSAAAKFSSSLGDANDKSTSGTNPGNFDLFLFASSWSPRFCCDSPKQCTAESMQGIDDLATHGLWPAFLTANEKGRTYPAFCPTQTNYSGKGRAQHEWDKHGTCTSMNPSTYFDEEVRLQESDYLAGVRDLLNENAGESVRVDDLLAEFGGPTRAALMANQKCQLQEITTCWSKKINGQVGEPMDCPSHVLGSSRNSALLNGCRRVALDLSNQCQAISKQLLHSLKSDSD